MPYHCCFKSELGFVRIEGNDEGILSIKTVDIPDKDSEYITDEMKKCISQLEEYFDGKRKEFDLKLILNGTEFQKTVWRKLMEIPYGKTASYKDIAIAIGKPTACRAVGGANNKNKLWMFFVKYFSLKKASEFPFFSKGFSLPSAGIMHPCA